MTMINKLTGRLLGVFVIGLVLAFPWARAQAAHEISGISGQTTFNLYAFPFNMNLPDGSSIHMWGFGDMDGSQQGGYNVPQYPAPTLIVNQGESITINLTNYVPRRNLAVVQEQLRGGRTTMPHLVQLLPHREARERALHQEGRHPARARLRVRLRVQHQCVRDRAVRDEVLNSVQYVFIALPDGTCLDTGCIAACIWFSQAEAREGLTSCQIR